MRPAYLNAILCKAYRNLLKTEVSLIKHIKCFFVHTTPEEFNIATITGHLNLCLRKTRSGKSRDQSDAFGFKKSAVSKLISVHAKTKSWRFQLLRFEERFRNARFQDGDVWPHCGPTRRRKSTRPNGEAKACHGLTSVFINMVFSQSELALYDDHCILPQSDRILHHPLYI